MISAIRRTRSPAWAAALAASVALAAACSPQSSSAADEFAWEPVAAEVAAGNNVRVAVRLTGPQGVVTLDDDAVDAARIDMGPAGMASMAAPLRPVAPEDGESLAWETDLAMAGQWALKVTATVPGEPEPVSGEVIITAKDE